MNALDIELALVDFFGSRKFVMVPNVSFGLGLNYEADLMVLTPTDFLYEVEIKVTKSDMKADLKKHKAHSSIYVKRLYYAFPENLLNTALEILPEEAGLFVAHTQNNGSVYVKLKRKPVDRKDCKPMPVIKQFQLARLGVLRMWVLKNMLYSKLPKQTLLNFRDSNVFKDL